MAGGAFIDGAVIAIQLDAVTLLEAVVEVFEELIEGGRGLVVKLGEDERFGLVAHVSEPRWDGVEESRSAD